MLNNEYFVTDQLPLISDDDLMSLLGPSVAGLAVNATGIIIKATPKLEKLFGYNFQGELSGQRLDILIPPQFRERHTKHFEAFFQNPHPRPMTGFMGWTKNGTAFDCAIELGAGYLTRHQVKVATALVTERLPETSVTHPPELPKR